MLLSRVANSIYWMSRYIERAENIARLVDVNLQLTMENQTGMYEQWTPLIQITSAEEAFGARYPDTSRQHIMRFLTTDATYGNSIVSCVAAARENARTVRDAITSEMWRQINALHIMVKGAGEEASREDRPQTFYDSIRYGSQLFAAITDATMSHNSGWEFCQLGRFLERADKTSRILDVKYFLLLPKPDDVGSALDAVQWAALLRSAGALEMYRQEHGAIKPDRVAEYLLLDHQFPRSLSFCLKKAEESLLRIVGHETSEADILVQRRLGRLRSELAYGDIHEIIDAGLHEYLDGFQHKLNSVDAAMNASFFNIPADDDELSPAPLSEALA